MKQTLADLKISVIYNRDNEIELDIKQLLFSDVRKRDGPEYEPDGRNYLEFNGMMYIILF